VAEVVLERALVLNYSKDELMYIRVTWDHCTVNIAECLSRFVEGPAVKVRIERTKATIVRTSMPISSGICEVKGPVIRIVKFVSDKVIWIVSVVE
jgi:hypothetical protein